MIADGGTPARRYPAGASVAETTAMIRAYASEQALANAETARRLAALERDKTETDRRLAELENRRATVVTAVQAFASLFSLVYSRYGLQGRPRPRRGMRSTTKSRTRRIPQKPALSFCTPLPGVGTGGRQLVQHATSIGDGAHAGLPQTSPP
jgi:hypothetical protein